MRRTHISLLVVILFVVCAFMPQFSPQAQVPDTVPEGNDFATRVLTDPWDMNEYSDVSQYLNASNNYVSLDNISVADGLFSFREFDKPDPRFFVLFPGYTYALQVGKVGNVYHIPSATYHCLYYAMQSSVVTQYTYATWYQNDIMPGTFGMTVGRKVLSGWNLYSWDLEQSLLTGTQWSAQAQWAGLDILPVQRAYDTTAQPTVTVDWVRLTDCNPVNHRISNTSKNPVKVYLQPNGTNRKIAVASGTGIYQLDVQGIQPGQYSYTVEETASGATVGSGDFTINQAPIIRVEKPSMTSGENYATSAGNPWDMTDTVDAEDTYSCMDESYDAGILSFFTPDKTQQPAQCLGGSFNDPILYLNSPNSVDIDPSQYRYLSFRTYTDGVYQDVVNGMMIRWGWATGLLGNTCKAVGDDIPFDVGWNTYSLDLHAGDNGSIISIAGNCPPRGTHWQDVGMIEMARFDPNENQLGRTLLQKLDWIKLTKMDQVQAGSVFMIKILVNKPRADFTTLSYYYTTNPSTPTQHAANEYVLPARNGPFFMYAPGMSNHYGGDFDPNAIQYSWDTSGVAAGEYYVCVVADDGYNTNTFCSHAPVQVY